MSATPEPAESPEPRQNSTRLSRDDRIRVLVLRDAGHTYEQITNQLGVTYRQVEYTCQTHQATPKKAHGQFPKLSDDEVTRIIEFISSSKLNRRKSYKKVIKELNLPVGETALARALRKRGYHRCKSLRKPPLSEQSKHIRLAWALEHINWTMEQWCRILWSDETWVSSGSHKRIFVTRKAGEELNETCLQPSLRRKNGWMFWGSFHGFSKGPCLFWEKEWGYIDGEKYSERIVPIIDGYIRLLHQHNIPLQLMQDGAPGHSSRNTLDELNDRGIYPITWPAFSPDLNPIEMVWNWMKDWIEEQYPDDKGLSYDRLREVVRASWDAVPEDFLKELVESMPARCQAVIDAEGGHTKY